MTRATSKQASNGIDKSTRALVKAVTRFPGSTSAELARHCKKDRYKMTRTVTAAERSCLITRSEPRVCDVSGHYALTWHAFDGPDSR